MSTDSTYTHALGSVGGGGSAGGITWSRVDADDPAVAVPPTTVSGALQPTVTAVPVSTRIPTGYIQGAWTWFDGAAYGYMPVFRLSRTGSRVSGVVTYSSSRFSVRGTYTGGGTLHLEWTMPHHVYGRIDATLSSNRRSIHGTSGFSPVEEGSADIVRDVAPIPTLPPTGPTPTVVPCTAGGSGLTATWAPVDPGTYVDSRLNEAALILRQSGTRITGVAVGPAEHDPVTVTYNNVASGHLTLMWSHYYGRRTLTGTVARDLQRIQGAYVETGTYSLPHVALAVGFVRAHLLAVDL